jgi:V/A-type H+-transporting ATPase subunit C
VRLGGRYSDEIYATVKASASRGTLLPGATLENLAEAKSLDELVTRLKGTVYGEALAKVERPYTAGRLELAFREHLARLHYRLTAVTPFAPLLGALYHKYIVSDLKLVLKGKALGKPYAELAQHLDLAAEELIGRRDIVVRALSAPGLEEAAALLRDTEFGSEVDRAVVLFKEKGEVQLFDLFLDHEFYRALGQTYAELLGAQRYSGGQARLREAEPLVALDIDAYNVLAVLRAKLWELSPSEARGLIVEPTFRARERDLKAMIEAPTVQDAVKFLHAWEYRKLLPAAGTDAEFLASLEDAFVNLSYERALHPFLWDVGGLSLAVGLVRLKELETRNLGAISFGVEANLGFQAIRARVITVRAP